MPAAAWVTLIITALIIAVTAVGLLRVIFHLRAIRATLRRPPAGFRPWPSSPYRSGPADSVNASLKPVRDFCETV